ncbi:PepSY-associated TM helix domain-containing protein [Xylophilus sp. GW821-FHT01B05]
MRKTFLLLHRWAGLFMAVFLAIAGLTGAAIAWEHELDRWLNPQLFTPQSQGLPALPAAEIARRLEAANPRLQVSLLPLAAPPGETLLLGVEPRLDPATGRAHALGFDQMMVDPATAQVQGTRTWGTPSLAPENLVPFLYRLHHTLCLPHLAGVDWAVWFMGLVAMVWTLDCLIALWLSFPRWRNWRKSLAFRFSRGGQVLNFDLHRSGGVWTWAALLVLAVTSVAMNLYDEVMEPVVSVFSPTSPSPFDQRPRRAPAERRPPAVSVDAVTSLAHAEGLRRGFADPPGMLSHRAAFGLYAVDFYVPGSARPGLGPPRLYFDSATGALVGDRVPGQGSAGDYFMRLQFPLHSGRIAGVPGRILVTLLGLAVAALSTTGVLLWAMRRRAAAAAAPRRPAGGA